EGDETFVGEAWVTAEAPAFSLAGARPNPVVGGKLMVHFVVSSSEPARLELYDVGGRRFAAQEVGSLGPGQHTVELSAGVKVPPGLYLIRFSQGANNAVARVAVLE